MFALRATGTSGARGKILAESSTALSVITNMLTLHATRAGCAGRISLPDTIAALAELADIFTLGAAGAGCSRREVLTDPGRALPVVTEVLAFHAARASRARRQVSKGPCGYQGHSCKYEGSHYYSLSSHVADAGIHKLKGLRPAISYSLFWQFKDPSLQKNPLFREPALQAALALNSASSCVFPAPEKFPSKEESMVQK
jgi:hypothetical protein